MIGKALGLVFSFIILSGFQKVNRLQISSEVDMERLLLEK